MATKAFNWGFVVIPAGFKEAQIPALVEKMKEMMHTASISSNQKDLLFGIDVIETNQFGERSRVMIDITEMTKKIGNPLLIGEAAWKNQFTILFLQGIQSDDIAVKAITIKTVKTIAAADMADKVWLQNIGLPTVVDMCKMYAESFA